MLAAALSYLSDTAAADAGGVAAFDWLVLLYPALLVLAAIVVPKRHAWISAVALFWPLGFWLTALLLR